MPTDERPLGRDPERSPDRDLVVGALRVRNALQDAGFPSEAAREAWHQHVRDGHTGFFAQCASVATDLPAILRATLPHWSAEDKAWVLRALLEERLERCTGDEMVRAGIHLSRQQWLSALDILATRNGNDDTQNGNGGLP